MMLGFIKGHQPDETLSRKMDGLCQNGILVYLPEAQTLSVVCPPEPLDTHLIE